MDRPGGPVERIKRRRDFLKAAKSPAWRGRSAIVQARDRGDDGPARVGFTVTRKLGNAVARNRIRRRLKEAVRMTAHTQFVDGCDYVFIGRQMAASMPFDAMCQDIETSLERLNAGQSNHQFSKRPRR